MAEEVAKAAAEAGTKAVMDLSLAAGAFSFSLKIDNVWLAGAVSVGALSLGAFYLACKGPSEDAIRRALEKRLFGVVDPKVTKITDGHSILIELLCSTEASFLLFLEDFETKTTKFRLEEELKKIGFKTELDVIIRNSETVYKQAIQIRERSRAQGKVIQQITWKEKYEELAQMVNTVYGKQALVPQPSEAQPAVGTDETINRLQWLDRYLSEVAQINKHGGTDVQGSKDLQAELDNIKETLKREMAISKGLRRTIEKLQEGNKRLGETSERAEVDGIEIIDHVKVGKEEIRSVQSDCLELREKVHELEKENESLQQKLKKKDKELERFQALETDVDIPQSRPRASSGTSLGASSGYQSEEDPDESSLEIIQMPRSQAVQEGKKLVLSCRTRGLPDVRYRWVKDDIEIPGANRSDLVLEPVRMQDFGRYVCRVWDKSGSATSDPAEIYVFPAPQMSDGLREVQLYLWNEAENFSSAPMRLPRSFSGVPRPRGSLDECGVSLEMRQQAQNRQIRDKVLGFRGLHEIDGDTKQAIIDLLSKKRLPGLASWKQVARRYAMRETEISSLEIEKTPACALLERLKSLAPNLTVYYLCKTFKEAGLRRLDVVDVLSKQMVIPAH